MVVTREDLSLRDCNQFIFLLVSCYMPLRDLRREAAEGKADGCLDRFWCTLRRTGDLSRLVNGANQLTLE